jgi:hypothetical protein
MWHFYRRVVRHTPSVLLQALKRMDTGVGMLSLVFAAAGFAAWQDYLPWWGPYAAFGAILFYGFLQSAFEESQRETANVALDMGKLRAYQSRDTSKIVVQHYEYEPTHMGVGEQRDEEGYADTLVPYDPDYLGAPAVSHMGLDVGTLGGDYYITLDECCEDVRPTAP